jgi:hypothetical protein
MTPQRRALLQQERRIFQRRLDTYGKRMIPGGFSAIREGMSRERLQARIDAIDAELAAEAQPVALESAAD